jgi:hypothetical protein
VERKRRVDEEETRKGLNYRLARPIRGNGSTSIIQRRKI